MYEFDASTMELNFIPYLAGFDGIYCLIAHLPRKEYNVSSMHKSFEGS